MNDLFYIRMKTSNLISLLLIAILAYGCKGVDRDMNGNSRPIKHDTFDKLLKVHVDEGGMVNYEGFIADSLELNVYLKSISTNVPNPQYWSQNEELSYWINAYNAFTIQLIIRNYPLVSIKDVGEGLKIPFVNSPWDFKFIPIGKNLYDLNNIEHGTIRKEFDEPRIHFALVCAAVSCPRLLNEAYVPERLNEQLDLQARHFINDSNKNKITEDQLSLSKLFSWYKGDFTKELSLIDYLNQYSEVKISKNASIDNLDYDWKLNVQKK